MRRRLSRRGFLRMLGAGALGAGLSAVGGRHLRSGGGRTGLVAAQDADITVDPGQGETLADAVGAADSGDTILLRGGTDSESAPLVMRNPDDVTIQVAQGERFVLDASGHQPSDPRSAPAFGLIRVDGVTVDGGAGRFVVADAGSAGILIRHASGFTLRGVTVRGCALSGILGGESADEGLIEWCASFNNSGEDVGEAGNADGFHLASKESDDARPANNTIRYCLAHHNSDDGYDVNKTTETTIERCIAYRNGYLPDGRESPAPGVGFKLSYSLENNYARHGLSAPDDNRCTGCISWGNGAGGAMVGSGSIILDRFTAFRNGQKDGDGDIMFWDPDDAELRNLLVETVDPPGAVTTSNIRATDRSGWAMDTAVDGSFAPTSPDTFAVPGPGSGIADRGVGAVQADGTFHGTDVTLAAVLAQDTASGTGGRDSDGEGDRGTGPARNRLRLQIDPGNRGVYLIEAAGPIEKVTQPDIQADPQDGVLGNKAFGTMGGGSDTFDVAGRIVAAELSGPITVYWNWQEMTPREFRQQVLHQCPP